MSKRRRASEETEKKKKNSRDREAKTKVSTSTQERCQPCGHTTARKLPENGRSILQARREQSIAKEVTREEVKRD